MPTTEWTKDEIESLISLPEQEQLRFLESLTATEQESLTRAMGQNQREAQEKKTKKANIEKRRQSSAEANRKRTAAGSTVVIPELSVEDRKRRAELEADNEAWVWEMCGPKSGIRKPLTRKFTSQQCVMIGSYDDTLRHGGDELILASRGEGKTTYLRAMVWKSIVEGLVDFVGFISATGDGARKSAEAIKSMIQRSDPFLRYYPEVAIPCRKVGRTSQLANNIRATGARHDNSRETFEQTPVAFSWTSEELTMPDVPGSPSAGSIMVFSGADSPIRGLNIEGRRPKVVVMDDLDTPETTGNPDVAKKVIDRVNLDIGGLGTQDEPLARIMLATLPKSGIGVAHHFANVGYPFVVRRFQYMIEKPVRMDLWMEYVKIRQKGKIAGDKHGRRAHGFYLANRSDMDAGAEVSNWHRFKPQELPDGSQLQVSAIQNYFDEWADKDEFFCRCELDNETIVNEDLIESTLELGHVMHSENDERPRGKVSESTSMIVRGIDVRKTELHFSTLAPDGIRRNRVVDYDVRSHGTSETTVEQAEHLILEGLHKLADEWKVEGHSDRNGGIHHADLTLIDKGWMGSWTEDGEKKTWASQPVERFCMERGLRRFLPAKGAPNYRSPAPAEGVIIGDNWHMNRGEGAERSCTEVIWNAEHWHSLVEDLFMLPFDDEESFELFQSEQGVWFNHKRLAEHIRAGAEDLADLRRRATKTRKARRRRDHWWDSFAMMLVARSIEEWFRANLFTRKRRTQPPRQVYAADIGAR